MHGCSIARSTILKCWVHEIKSLLNEWCTGGDIILKSDNYGGTKPVY